MKSVGLTWSLSILSDPALPACQRGLWVVHQSSSCAVTVPIPLQVNSFPFLVLHCGEMHASQSDWEMCTFFCFFSELSQLLLHFFLFLFGGLLISVCISASEFVFLIPNACLKFFKFSLECCVPVFFSFVAFQKEGERFIS